MIATTSLAVFSEICGDGDCGEAENRVRCPLDCTIEDNFCELSRCNPDCLSQESCERNRRIMLVFSIILIVLALILLIVIIVQIRYDKD